MAKQFWLSPAQFARLQPLLPSKLRGWMRTGDCQAQRPGEERVMDKQARDRFPALRRWVAVGVMFVVCAVSGPASAEPLRSRWYIGGGLGVSGVHDMEERGWNRDTYCYPSACDEPGLSADIAGVAIPGYRWAYDLDLDIGTAFEVAVGRTFNRWRLELAYAHRKNDVDQTFTGTAYLDGGPRVQPSAGNRVVFWFGPEKCKPGVDGRPRSVDELERRLECTLSPDEACKVSVCVIDVTKPFDSASDRSG